MKYVYNFDTDKLDCIQDLSGYLKLDQTDAQTTTGTFTFPRVMVDTGTDDTISKLQVFGNALFYGGNVVVNSGQTYRMNVRYNPITIQDEFVDTGYASDFYTRNDDGKFCIRTADTSGSAGDPAYLTNKLCLTKEGNMWTKGFHQFDDETYSAFIGLGDGSTEAPYTGYWYEQFGNMQTIIGLQGSGDESVYIGYNESGTPQEFVAYYVGVPNMSSFESVKTQLTSQAGGMWEVSDTEANNSLKLQLYEGSTNGDFRVTLGGETIIYGSTTSSTMAYLTFFGANNLWLGGGSGGDDSYGRIFSDGIYSLPGYTSYGTDDLTFCVQKSKADANFRFTEAQTNFDNDILVHDLTGAPGGSELVTNGTFAADSDWTKGSGWTISTGRGRHASNGTGTLSQAFTGTAGKYYQLSYKVANSTSGGVNVSVAGHAWSSQVSTTSDGTTETQYVHWFKALNTNAITFTPPNNETRCTIDDVTIKEITTGAIIRNDGSIKSSGSQKNVRILTSGDTLITTDDVVIGNSTNAFTITLPVATGSGQNFVIKNINTGLITLEGNSSDTIDGELNQSINQWDAIYVVDYETNKWAII